MQKFLKTPYYFQWFILFFVLHAYTEFIGLITITAVLWLIVKLSVAAWLLFFMLRRIYGEPYKAALLTTVMFGCYLLFGAVQDFFSHQPAVIFLSYFWVLIPLLLLICLAVSLYKRPVTKLARLLNLLLLIYIVYDVMVIIGKPVPKAPAPQMLSLSPAAAQSPKPDVYFILLDEYLGTAGLKTYFNYNNAAFETALQQRGFHINKQSLSNYYSTIHSMASLLNMRYLGATDRGLTSADDYQKMLHLIDDNLTCNTFKKLNYTVRNFSPFTVAGQDRTLHMEALPRGIELITDRLAYQRIVKRIALGDPPAGKTAASLVAWLYNDVEEGHRALLKQALQTAGKDAPAFTYIHLLMPHKPYVYDSTGRPAGSFDAPAGNHNRRNDALYLQYLVHTNHRMQQFIDRLLKATNGQAVIMLMSDHGYRDAHGKAAWDVRFNTLNAVYLPNKDYRLWYDSVTNVNQFRLLFNTLFGQQLPLQKDSCVY